MILLGRAEDATTGAKKAPWRHPRRKELPSGQTASKAIAVATASGALSKVGAMSDEQSVSLADLKKVVLFENLVHGHLKLVADIAKIVDYTPGDVVFKDGDPADRFYFLVSGKVRISKQIPGMGEEALAILEPGAYFGEMALIDDRPRSADAIANTKVKVGIIESKAFEDLLFIHKDLAYDLLWTFVRTLSGRLRESNEKMRAFLTMAGQF